MGQSSILCSGLQRNQYSECSWVGQRPWWPEVVSTLDFSGHFLTTVTSDRLCVASQNTLLRLGSTKSWAITQNSELPPLHMFLQVTALRSLCFCFMRQGITTALDGRRLTMQSRQSTSPVQGLWLCATKLVFLWWGNWTQGFECAGQAFCQLSCVLSPFYGLCLFWLPSFAYYCMSNYCSSTAYSQKVFSVTHRTVFR